MAALLLVTHGHVGEAMLSMAVETLGRCPLPVMCLPVTADDDPIEVLAQGHRIIDRFDSDEVVVLTDLFGSTPSNIAARLVREHSGLVMVTGLNIPMLIRALNYVDLDMEALVEKVISGGRDGIFVYDPAQDD